MNSEAVVEETLALETAEELSLTTNIYKEIRARLALRGVPPEQIAFIHDARTPEARAALFQAVNSGEIRVLIGSTEKMGTGMNVQERCIATHTITPPWRPGDIEQQVGRMLRQGNLFPQVFQFVHITESSFDAYIWQLLENKAGFIGQASRGQIASREMDDVDQTVLTFSEIKALASGNPKIMQKVVLDSELARLNAIRSTWLDTQASLRSSLRFLATKKAGIEASLTTYRAAIERRDENTTEDFSVRLKASIDADTLELETDRETAGRKLRLLAGRAAARLISGRAAEQFLELGSYKGFPIYVTVSRFADGGLPEPSLFFKVGNEILPIGGTNDVGVTRSMDIRLRSLDDMLANALEQISVTESKTKAAEAELDRPWEHEERYAKLEADLQSLEAELNVEAPTAPLYAHDLEDPGEVVDENEMRSALDAITAMLADPGVLARFDTKQESIPVTPESLEALGKEIEQMQALFDMGAALVQLDLFGGFAAPAARKRRRR